MTLPERTLGVMADHRVTMNLPWDEAMKKVYMLIAHNRQGISSRKGKFHCIMEGMNECTSATQLLLPFCKKDELICNQCRDIPQGATYERWHKVLFGLKNEGYDGILMPF